MLSKAHYTITGGIHLPDNKLQSSEADLQICPVPNQIMIPLNMHAGTDAIAIVKPGDKVKTGQCIAESNGVISAHIHSPVDAQVTDIIRASVANHSGVDETVLVLDCNQQLAFNYDRVHDWQNNSPEQLLEKIMLAGIVGLGGGGFPIHNKISSSISITHTLLLNGVECEPYISCDDRTMRDFGIKVLEGALILSKILNCDTIQIAIEDNKPEALATMVQNIVECRDKCDANKINIEVIEILTRYPSGGERQLIEIVSGKQVPSGSLPSALGYIVQNVGTALAVYDAVVLEKPLIERIVTVTGDAVSCPGNYRVTIGTSIRNLLEFAGWDESKTSTLIHGGPMMGFPLPDPDRPISKISNCIIAGTVEEFPEPIPERNCIRCGKCAEVCPASIMPQQLLWFSKSDNVDKAKEFRLMDCIECGACAFVCSSHIPLVDYFRYIKGVSRSESAAKIKSEKSKQRFEFRQHRLELQKLEKMQLREEKMRKLAERKRLAEEATEYDQQDQKKQAVADALARVQARKKAKQDKICDNPKSEDNN